MQAKATPGATTTRRGQNDPEKSLKTSIKIEIDPEAWASLNSDTSVPSAKPKGGRIVVKVMRPPRG